MFTFQKLNTEDCKTKRSFFLLPLKCVYKCITHVWAKNLNKTLKLNLVSSDLECIYFIHQVLMNSYSFVHQFLKFPTSFPSSGNLKSVSLFLIFLVERENVQKRTFTRWINLHLGKVRLTVLISGYKDIAMNRLQLTSLK